MIMLLLSFHSAVQLIGKFLRGKFRWFAQQIRGKGLTQRTNSGFKLFDTRLHRREARFFLRQRIEFHARRGESFDDRACQLSIPFRRKIQTVRGPIAIAFASSFRDRFKRGRFAVTSSSS